MSFDKRIRVPWRRLIAFCWDRHIYCRDKGRERRSSRPYSRLLGACLSIKFASRKKHVEAQRDRILIGQRYPILEDAYFICPELCQPEVQSIRAKAETNRASGPSFCLIRGHSTFCKEEKKKQTENFLPCLLLKYYILPDDGFRR